MSSETHVGAVRIQEALGDVLQSPFFRNSRQCQNFLKHIVEHTVGGENDRLRERVIGTEVFGRPSDYEPSQDPIVRTRAAEVRKRLAQYYHERGDSLVIIDIPSGSYRAIIQYRPLAPASPGPIEPLAPASPGPIEPPPSHEIPWRRIGAAVLAILALVVGVRVLSRVPIPLDQFWAPALSSPKPILIYNATNTVFQSPDGTETPHDVVTVRGQYTCVGDAYAGAVLSALFSRKGKPFQIRYGTDLSFSDLRYQPSILIGAFNNGWTLQMTNELRFVFDKHPTIRDRSNNRLYTLTNLKPDGRTTQDYAVVSRVFDSKTGELLIAAAGITQYGTRAAGEFITSPNLMVALAANAPRDWPKKNLQVLLKTNIVADTPGPPSIVAQHFW